MKTLFLSMCLFLVMSCVGCQKNPDEIVVFNKNKELTYQEVDEIDQISTPTKLEKNYSVISTIETIVNIDADIVFPDTKAFPVYEVKYKPISDDIAEAFIDSVSFKKPLRNQSLSGGVQYSKQEIEKFIEETASWLSDPSGDLYEVRNENPTAYEEFVEEQERTLQYWQEQYELAPDSADIPIIEGKIQWNMDKQYGELAAEYTFDKDQNGKITVISDKGALANIMSFSLEGKYNVITLPANPYVEVKDGNTMLTKDEAEKIAQSFVAKVCDYQLVCSGVKRCVDVKHISGKRTRLDGYEFVFVPVEENGAFRTYVDASYLANNTSAAPENTYHATWMQPSLSVIVNEQGIVRITWNSVDSEEVIKKTVENVKLLPFDDVLKLFEKNIGYAGNYLLQHGKQPKLRELHITEIRFGYMRVAQRNQTDEYLLIPVWDFLGYETNKFSSQEDTEWELDENLSSTRQAIGHSYLTLNAIDGSIINRVLGY